MGNDPREYATQCESQSTIPSEATMGPQDPTCPVLANTLSISVKGIQGADVVKELGDKVGISAGKGERQKCTV